MKLQLIVSMALAAAALGAAPTALAFDPVCVDAVCVTGGSGSDGSGSCDEGAPYYQSGNSAAVSVGGESSYRTLYVTSQCYAYNGEGYWETGSYTGVGYFGYDDSTGDYASAGVQWYEFAFNFGSECNFVVYSYGTVAFGSERVACPDGVSPVVLPPVLP